MKDEATDMGEECNTTATGRIWVDSRDVALEQLGRQPEAEEEPCREAELESRATSPKIRALG